MSRRLASLLFAASLCLVPVYGQEGKSESAEKAEKHEEGDKMIVWKWANFAILMAGLGYLASKNLTPFLAERSTEIKAGLAAGENAKVAAEARAAAVQVKLDGLGATIAALKAEARVVREREGVRLRHETELELARIAAQGAQEIESASKLARMELQRYAAKLAIDLATQKVRSRMNGDVQAALMDNFIGGLADRSAEAKTSSAKTKTA